MIVVQSRGDQFLSILLRQIFLKKFFLQYCEGRRPSQDAFNVLITGRVQVKNYNTISCDHSDGKVGTVVSVLSEFSNCRSSRSLYL